ncbi:bacteriohemerythrin [Variovorax sp. KK3]|uniref:bacteriohemerythrin n=1 Tax=Variovorax sp. KK3 TaxID=1855728 RepID=UPI00097BECF2|nr:hemerythrin family protein [Variovorax sp. KK3]
MQAFALPAHESTHEAPPDLSLATGHAQFDDDHDALMAASLELRVASDEAFDAGFAALHAHFADHFATEDELMATHDFASRECHLDEHAAVLRSFDEARQLLREGRREPARRMTAEIVNWLPGHIDALDRQLAKFLFHRRTGGAPVLLRR